MPRAKNKATPSDDYGWIWGDPIEGNNRRNVRFKFCDRVMTGRITRLKEHLGAKRGNVVPCPNVSAEVRIEIAKQLEEYGNENAAKQRRKEELEERLRLGDQGDYGDIGDDDDEEQLSAARRESIRSQGEWEERQLRRAQTGQDSVYETGGGSSESREIRRSSSVCIDDRSGRGQQWSNIDSPRVRLRNMDPIAERSKSSKQSTIGTNFLKNAKAKLGKALSKLILHETLPARIVESPFLKHVLEVAKEHGKHKITVPTAYEVTGKYLNEEYKEIQEWVDSFKPIWAERGVTIMCDGWKGTTNAHIINFLVVNNDALDPPRHSFWW